MNQIILSLAVLIFLFASCANETTKKNQAVPETEVSTELSLQDELDVKKKAFAEKAPEAKKKLYTEGIETVAKSGILEAAKQLGDRAPDFSLTNAINESIKLSDYLTKGPVILTWYRGGWCPYCNITLHRLQKELPKFTELGATLIALSPELPDHSMSTKEKNELTFEVLSDIGNKVARDYGVVYKLPDPVAEAYDNAARLFEYNGDQSNELPLAATYVIAQDGTIQFAFLDADYKNRAEPDEIIRVLERLK